MFKNFAIAMLHIAAFAIYGAALMFVVNNFVDDILQWKSGLAGATSTAINIVAFAIITAFVTRDKGSRWGE